MSTDPRDARDLEMLRRVAAGETPQQIADAMGLSLRVVVTILYLDAAAFPDEPPETVH